MSGSILAVLVIEYVLFFHGMINTGGGGLSLDTWAMLLCGYVLLTVVITCNSHDRRVRVRYERELSFILKAVVCNVVMLVFFTAVTDVAELWSLAGEQFNLSGLTGVFGMMTLVQVASVVIVCRVWEKIAGKKKLKRLYIYESHFMESESGKCCRVNSVKFKSEQCCGVASVKSGSEQCCGVASVKSGSEQCSGINSVKFENEQCCGINSMKSKNDRCPEALCINDCSENELFEKIMDCDEVYLYDLSAQKRNDIMKFCFYNHKPVYFTCKLSDMELRSAVAAQDGDRLIFYNDGRVGSGLSRALKRLIDVVVSGVGLAVLSPLFGIIALAIKIEDGGAVFYRQARCTENQREFKIIKFRSMVVGAEKQVGVKLADKRDSRLTRVGYFLRRFKLDELPQLINIFKGDMSLVGPRPERPELIDKIVGSVPEFKFRTKVRAGLTGYAQVHGDYHTDFLEKLKWDLMYIENFSLLLDLKIILMTIPVLFRGSDDV